MKPVYQHQDCCGALWRRVAAGLPAVDALSRRRIGRLWGGQAGRLTLSALCTRNRVALGRHRLLRCGVFGLLRRHGFSLSAERYLRRPLSPPLQITLTRNGAAATCYGGSLPHPLPVVRYDRTHHRSSRHLQINQQFACQWHHHWRFNVILHTGLVAPVLHGGAAGLGFPQNRRALLRLLEYMDAANGVFTDRAGRFGLAVTGLAAVARPACIAPPPAAADADHVQGWTVRRHARRMNKQLVSAASLRQSFIRASLRSGRKRAGLLAVTGRTLSGRLDMVSAVPARPSGFWIPSQHRLDALVTKRGEKCGPDEQSLYNTVSRHVERIGSAPVFPWTGVPAVAGITGHDVLFAFAFRHDAREISGLPPALQAIKHSLRHLDRRQAMLLPLPRTSPVLLRSALSPSRAPSSFVAAAPLSQPTPRSITRPTAMPRNQGAQPSGFIPAARDSAGLSGLVVALREQFYRAGASRALMSNQGLPGSLLRRGWSAAPSERGRFIQRQQVRAQQAVVELSRRRELERQDIQWRDERIFSELRRQLQALQRSGSNEQAALLRAVQSLERVLTQSLKATSAPALRPLSFMGNR